MHSVRAGAPRGRPYIRMAFMGICTGFARDADYGVTYGVDVATNILIA